MESHLLRLVPAIEEEREFSFDVKRRAEGAYIKAIWGWDEDLQRRFHASDWEERRPEIIMYAGEPIGTMYVRNEDGPMFIRQFFILPLYQGRGIGSALVERALREADHAGRLAKVAFLEGNRVESLYRRFGFYITERRDKYCFMERAPQEGERTSSSDQRPGRRG